ncbi:MAG: SDR family NAD(P)-dependent oxidoreductase [Sphingomicrobium sp.]
MTGAGEGSAEPKRAIVIGSSGGIGAALASRMEDRGFAVARLSRSAGATGSTTRQPIDITDEASIARAAASLAPGGPYSVVIVASGLLHDEAAGPEKSLRDLDRGTLLNYFDVNAVGPALAAKHFIPLLPRHGKCIFAALTARVGSIADNRLGGWYGYRASKAALNMLIKTLAIEASRTRPEAICVGLHPGTVDTPLSKPFQRGVPAAKLFAPDYSAEHLLEVMENLTPAQTGHCFAWDGQPISP